MVKWDGSVVTRTAELEDCERTVSLLARQGLAVPTDPEVAKHTWEWLWKRNPALNTRGASLPLGWVLERGDDILGFFGNIAIRYHFGDEVVLTAVGSSWAVDTSLRARTRELVAAYFGQREADLLLCTTANKSAGRILAKFSAKPMPQRSYERVLYWVLDPGGFVRSALRKRELHPALRGPVGVALPPVLSAIIALQGRRPGRLYAGIDCDAVPLQAVGEDFDHLWRRKLGEKRRLYAGRSAEELRWHFELGAEAGTAVILGCRRRAQLVGYLALVRGEAPEIGLVRGRVADLLVESDDPKVVEVLLAAAYECARGWGCHVLEVLGLPSEIRSLTDCFRPFSRVLPTQPFWYKGLSPGLDDALLQEAAWYPTPYDGDTTLV